MLFVHPYCAGELLCALLILQTTKKWVTVYASMIDVTDLHYAFSWTCYISPVKPWSLQGGRDRSTSYGWIEASSLVWHQENMYHAVLEVQTRPNFQLLYHKPRKKLSVLKFVVYSNLPWNEKNKKSLSPHVWCLLNHDWTIPQSGWSFI